MFRAVSRQDLDEIKPIRESMFADRAHQFVARHRWPLRVDAQGREIDEFDDAAATYCIVESVGCHLASLRLRPADAGSMLERYFPALWGAASETMRAGIEVTRFCAAPALRGEARIAAVSDLLLGLCRHCRKTDAATIFGVVFPSVARTIAQAGWPARVVAEAIDGRGELLLAEWTATERVAWDIQERHELRKEFRRVRRTDAPERRVA